MSFMIADHEIAPNPNAWSAAKQALLEQRLRRPQAELARPPAILRRAANSPAPLSFAQEQLWFCAQMAPQSPRYNISTAVRLDGKLDHEALGRALSAIAARHEALRTRFVAAEGEPAQVVDPARAVELPVIELPEPEARQWVRVEARRPFDLAKDLPLRALLFRLDPTRHILSITIHHIAADGWSFGIFFRELAAYYEIFSGRATNPPPALPIQFSDFAAWQRERMQGEYYERLLAYWRQQLAGAPALLELPSDRPRPAMPSFQGASETLVLPRELAARLRTLSRREGVTLFMLLAAAFKVLLHRYTGQTDLPVGTPIAGRTQIETEPLIGFFVNTLVLRGDLSGDPTFHQLAQRTRQVALDAFAHQDLPFEKLVEALRLERNLSYNPVFQVMFVMQNARFRPVNLAGLSLTPLEVDTCTSKFDLNLAVEENDAALHAALEYNTDLFDAATVKPMLPHFRNLLEAIAANPAQKIGELPMLCESERHRMLVDWNDTRTEYPRDKTIVELFDEQAASAPEAGAVVFGEEKLNYRQLNQRANQLAHYLVQIGVKPGAVVAVQLTRSLHLIPALLGILKAGGAYLALDSDSPPERHARVLQDAQAQFVLTEENRLDQFKAGGANLRVLALDANREAIERESVERLASGGPAGANALAYVCFTSGSTGIPKGVCVSHRGVVRLVRGTNYARFGADETFLQLAPLAFDASTLEIWGALLNGAKLVLFPAHTPSLAELGDFIQKHRITILWLTAGLFHQMVEEQIQGLSGVRQLLAGGDVLSVPHVSLFLEKMPACRLINGYGPTENTTFTCCHTIQPADAQRRSIPIGRPVANTQVYVLDARLQPVPVGAPGQLFVGGDGLADGYLNQPGLTAEKFVANPFSVEPQARLYQTGDRVRWLADGTLEFMGRTDNQVKIRGFRVELGEIESVLAQHPAVKTCAVTARSEGAGGKRLVGYVVATASPAPSTCDLQSFLRAKLPEYLVPPQFVFLEDLPLNANGKVARQALPAPEQGASGSTTRKFKAPRNETEARLAMIWEEVLENRPIGVEDHFFELGGHSLLAVRLVARIEKLLRKRIPVAAVFQCPTVAQLAGFLSNGKQPGPTSSIVEIQPRGQKPPLYLVHGVGGGMFWGYTNLSRHLGSDQPVFAFNSRGMSGQEEFGMIEEMAAQYVADLRAMRPRGPYCLGGYCFGGNVAFEMARQLEAEGEEISLLALIDCAPPNASYSRFRPTPKACLKFLKNFGYWVRHVAQLPRAQQRAFFLWKLRVLWKRMRRLLNRSGVDVDEVVDLSAQPEDRRDLWEAHVRALVAHHPKPYGGPVTLFRTQGHPLICSFDDALGWRELARELRVIMVPGAHEKALDEPHVQALARAITQCLSNVQRPQTGENT